MKTTLTHRIQRYRFPAALAAVACTLAGLAPAKEMSPEDIQAKARQIDQMVADKLAKENIEPTAPVTDDVFVRRVYLDIAGRIPTLKETTDFLGNPSADKRAELIEALLNSDGY